MSVAAKLIREHKISTLALLSHAPRSVNLMRSFSEVALIILPYIVAILLLNALPAKCAPSDPMNECETLESNFDYTFLKKIVVQWIPFTSSERVKMQFYLYKRDFPECGREISVDDDKTLEVSGFNAEHPTRILIHGWMGHRRGSFSQAVKSAYLSLTQPKLLLHLNGIDNGTAQEQSDTASTAEDGIDYNIIVADWSTISTNVNYFGVVDMIEELGNLLAEFVRHLHVRALLQFDNVYLIGHSLGAHIAGSAGKLIKPFKFNTIFALEPAGPKFRDLTDEFRIDSTDASYVESIQTSSTFGFGDPVGHATFYPNYGKDQKTCLFYSCSHRLVYAYFAESITSQLGFWGPLCQRQPNDVCTLSDSSAEFRMGGEPSTPKNGTFYVATKDEPPYALGKNNNVTMEELSALSINKITNVTYLATIYEVIN